MSKRYLRLRHAEDESHSPSARSSRLGIKFVHRQHEVIFEATKRHNRLEVVDIERFLQSHKTFQLLTFEMINDKKLGYSKFPTAIVSLLHFPFPLPQQICLFGL